MILSSACPSRQTDRSGSTRRSSSAPTISYTTDWDTIQTVKGPVTLRPERPDDEALLFRLFRSWALEDLEHMPVDAATKENLVRLQFGGQVFHLLLQVVMVVVPAS